MSLFKNLIDINHGYVYINNLKSLNSNKFIETFDSNKLVYILNNEDKIKEKYRDNARNLPILENYFKQSKNGELKVEYYQNENDIYGRYMAKGSLSGQNMVREVRHTIFKDKYIDVDIKNCHPNIIVWLCKNMDINFNYLNHYIVNRDEVLQELVDINPNLTKDYMKSMILALNNGGEKDYKSIVKNDFINQYKIEITTIRKQICSKLHKFTDKVKELNAGNDFNLEGKTMANICLLIENQILMIMMKYLKTKFPVNHFKNSILCFDGIMLRKESCLDIDIYIKEMEDIFIKNGLTNIKLSVKPLISLELPEYDPLVKYKLIEKTKSIEVIKKHYNKFEEDNYYWADLLEYFDNNEWNVKDTEPLQYLINNLHRVLAIINDNVMIKESDNNFTEVKSFAKFTSQEIHLVDDNNKDKSVNLGVYINKHKKHFNLFSKIDASYDFDCKDKRTFICSRHFIAKEIVDFETSSLIILKDFIKTNICSGNQEMYDYEIKKLAVMVKYPHLKTKTITLLLSHKQGCGKNLYTDFLCNRVFGSYNCISNLPGIEGLFRNENSMMFGKKLIVINEMASTKEEFISNFNKMKGLITESEQRVKFNYANAFMAKLSTEYYALSNHKNSYVIESEYSRREFVPDIDESYANNREYFAPIFEALNTPECGNAFYSYLMSQEITYDEFMKIQIPNSETKKQVVELNKSDLQLFLDYLLAKIKEKGTDDEDEDEVNLDDYMTEKSKEKKSIDIEIISSQLYKLWQVYANKNGCKHQPNKSLKALLEKHGHESTRTSAGITYKFTRPL